MKRPLVWVAVSMACGAYAEAFGWGGDIVLSLILCLAGALVPILLQSRRMAQPLATVLLFTGAGGLLWEAHHAGPTGDALSRWGADHRNAYVELEGTVRQPDLIIEGRSYASFVLDVEALRSGAIRLPLTGRTHVRWYAPNQPLSNHERVRVSGELASELGHVNPGVQDMEDYLRRRGVHTALHVRREQGVEIIDPSPWWSPLYWASRLRHAEAVRLRSVVPPSIYPFVLAVWLGDRRDVDEVASEAYIVSGTAHILAVSGVHMAILYTSVAFFLKLLWPSRVRLRAVITLFIVMLFALLTGARVSSLRAACMIALYLLADVLDREPDAPTALGIAGILFTVWTPDALLDVGFLLSFGSVASLLLYRDALESWLTRLTAQDAMRKLVVSRPTWRDAVVAYLHTRQGAAMELVSLARSLLWGARGGVSTALGVQILPLPLAVHFFHVLPLAAPLVNLLVVPLVGVVLWMCLLTTIAAFVAPPAALIFGHALTAPISAIQLLTAWTAKSGAYAMVTSPTPLAFACYWVLAFLVYVSLRGHLRSPYRHWALPACASVCIVFWSPWSPAAEVVFLDVDHGDATFLRAPDATTMLVDAGDRNGHVDRGKRNVAPFLWANHVRRLDYLIVTHSHSDHIGGARYVLDHFSVGTVILNAAPTNEALERELLAQCESLSVPVRRVSQGDVLRAGTATVTVLHPPPGWPGEPLNDASLVLRVEWPGMDVLLAGDIERKAEQVVVGGTCRASVLKVPHHGSNTSSSGEFLDVVQPQLAVISGVERGERGMHPIVLDRYRQRGIRVLRTDMHGAITLRVKDGRMLAVSERMRRGYLAGK